MDAQAASEGQVLPWAISHQVPLGTHLYMGRVFAMEATVA